MLTFLEGHLQLSVLGFSELQGFNSGAQFSVFMFVASKLLLQKLQLCRLLAVRLTVSAFLQ